MKSDEPTALERVTLRVSRFVRTVRPHVTNLDRALAEEWLSSDLLSLFLCQSEADQRHAINVTRLLLRNGYSSRDLIAAALLHDLGKCQAAFTPWHRSLIVILDTYAPWGLQWLAKYERYRLLAPFAAYTRHATVGAELARGAGASERTVYLIKKHHDKSTSPDDDDLNMLKWADQHA